MTELNMDQITSILNRYGVPAYVEQTGGGCATIYAGTAYPDDKGQDRYDAVAGPGWFDGPGFTLPRAETEEFYIGLDDDGESDPVVAGVAEDFNEFEAAAVILETMEMPDLSARVRFEGAFWTFHAAGMKLVEVWDVPGFNADEWKPLPDRLRPPLSLDEWLTELLVHYREA